MTGFYAAIQALYWAVYAVIYGYVSVYLLGSGFNNTLEGLIVSLGALGAAVLQPMIAAWTDQKGGKSLKKGLLVQTAVLAVSDVLLLVFKGEKFLSVTGIAYGLEILLLQVLTPFVYSLGTLSVKEGADLNFGLARGAGSAGYSIASFLAGRLINRAGIRLVPMICLPLTVLLGILILRFPYQGTKPAERTESEEKKNTVSFWKKYPSFCMALIGALLLYSCHMMVNTFGFQILASKGGNDSQLGLGIAIASMTEIPVMILFGKCRSHVHAEKWLILTGFFYIARTLVYLYGKGVGSFYLAQFMQIGSWAVLCIVTVIYTSGVMEEQDEVKGQAYFTMMLSIATVLSSVIGGVLLDHFGMFAMLSFALICSVLGTIIMVLTFHKK